MSRSLANQLAVGLRSPAIRVPGLPIIQTRAPAVNDLAEIGRIWVDKSADDAYICVNRGATGVHPNVQQTATWINSGGGSGVFSSLTVNPGPTNLTGTLTVTGDSTFNGDLTCTGTGRFNALIVDTGDITVPTGDINVTAGDLTLTAGDLFAVNGSFTNLVDANEFSSALGITSGISGSGNNPSHELFGGSNNNVGAQISFNKSRLGGVLTTGDQLGSIKAQGFDGTNYVGGTRIDFFSTGTIAAGQVPGFMQFYTASATGVVTLRASLDQDGLFTIAAPDTGRSAIIASASDVEADQLVANDDVAGTAAKTTFTNGDVTSVAGGAKLTIDSQSAVAGVNAGFIKIYVGATTAYIPYFTNISP